MRSVFLGGSSGGSIDTFILSQLERVEEGNVRKGDTKKKLMQRLKKARYRARKGKEALHEKRAAEKVRCADLAELERFLDKESEGGCWIWKGYVVPSWGRIVPFIRVGLGEMQADRAMWLATRGKRVPKSTWLARTCKRDDCLQPAHLYEENAVTKRAFRRQEDLAMGSQRAHKGVGMEAE